MSFFRKNQNAPKEWGILGAFANLRCGRCIALVADETKAMWQIVQTEPHPETGERRVIYFASPAAAERYVKTEFLPLFDQPSLSRPPVKGLTFILIPVCKSHLIESICKIGQGIIRWRDAPCENAGECEGGRSIG